MQLLKITTLILVNGLACFTSFLFAQTLDSAKVTTANFDTYDELIEKQKNVGIANLTYLDSTFSYQVKIPTWLHLRETGAKTIFGGTLPAVNEIENAIMIEGFPKSAFSSFHEFKEIYLTGNVFGQPVKYSEDRIWYGHDNKGVIKIPDGVKERVFTFWRNKIYHHLFVLLETRSAYLFIQFTSTPETYDTNIYKFDEFMSGLQLVDL